MPGHYPIEAVQNLRMFTSSFTIPKASKTTDSSQQRFPLLFTAPCAELDHLQDSVTRHDVNNVQVASDCAVLDKDCAISLHLWANKNQDRAGGSSENSRNAELMLTAMISVSFQKSLLWPRESLGPFRFISEIIACKRQFSISWQ